MKLLYTSILLLLIITGCQKDDNFLIKEEAFSVITSGFSTSTLEIRIDTLTLPYEILANGSFKRTDKYTFTNGQRQVKLVINEKGSGKQIYEKEVKKGEYSLVINLFYVNGALSEKPALPAEKDGSMQVSYMFMPRESKYTGDIDIVFTKRYDYIEDGQFKVDREEELVRVTTKPYAFSNFLQMPVFEQGRTEIDGRIFYVNAGLKIFKAGTSIPYYEDAGFTLNPYSFLPVPMDTKPKIIGLSELGDVATKYIDRFESVTF